jgi:hypothetical protein
VQGLFDKMTLPLRSLHAKDPEQIHASFELTLTLYGGVDTVTPAA